MLTRLIEQDFETFRPLLEQFPTTEYRDWSLLFTHGWNRIDATVGFGLVDEGRPVGYLGTIQTERTIAGVTFRNVNLSTWFVLKDYRAHSLDPQRAVLEYDNCVSVGHTIIPQVVKRYESIGYRGFDFFTRLMFFNPAAILSRGDGIETLIGRTVAAMCDDVERQLIGDHEPFGCVPLLFRTTAGDRCLVIAQRVIRRYKGMRLATAHCLYVSNREFFAATNAVTRNAIMSTLNCRLLACDERYMLGTTPLLSLKIPMITPRMSRNNIGFDPMLLDNLYTELVLMRY
jgi:hypothetical protein